MNQNLTMDNIFNKMDKYIIYIKKELAEKNYEKLNNILQNFNSYISMINRSALKPIQKIKYEKLIREYSVLLDICIEQSQIDRLNHL